MEIQKLKIIPVFEARVISREIRDKLAPPHMNEILKETLKLKNFSLILSNINDEITTRRRMKDVEGRMLIRKAQAFTAHHSHVSSTKDVPLIDAPPLPCKRSRSLVVKENAKKTKEYKNLSSLCFHFKKISKRLQKSLSIQYYLQIV